MTEPQSKDKVADKEKMQATHAKRTVAIYAILAWMIINIVFFILELTAIGDTMDYNNTIELILWIGSFAGLLSMRKWGAAFATFTITYAFSFNAFNLIYYWRYILLLNGISAILNAVTLIYMFSSILANKFR